MIILRNKNFSEKKEEKKGMSTGKKVALAAGGAAIAAGAVIGGKKVTKALKSQGKKVIKDRVPASRQIESKVKGEYMSKEYVTPDGFKVKETEHVMPDGTKIRSKMRSKHGKNSNSFKVVNES